MILNYEKTIHIQKPNEFARCELILHHGMMISCDIPSKFPVKFMVNKIYRNEGIASFDSIIYNANGNNCYKIIDDSIRNFDMMLPINVIVFDESEVMSELRLLNANKEKYLTEWELK